MGKNQSDIKNFPFNWNGEDYWYSRSVAVGLYVYCKNKKGEWCVLVDKRGEGAPTCKHKWNVPCGYLDFNEDLKAAAARECFEETGVSILTKDIHLCRVMSKWNGDGAGKRQNVIVSFYSVLGGYCEDYELTDANSEPNEVEGIVWYPVGLLGNLNTMRTFAFNHDNLAKRFFFDFVKVPFYKKWIASLVEKYIDL